jgi:hypothetical protein
MLNHGRLKRKQPILYSGDGNPRSDNKSSGQRSPNPGVLVLQIGGVDPFDTSPFELQPYMHDLLSYCTVIEFYISATKVLVADAL